MRYSYLALPRTCALVETHELEVQLRPVYPLAVRDSSFFQRTPPQFARYVKLDSQRVAAQAGIAFGMPRPDPIVQDMQTLVVAPAQPRIRRLMFSAEADRPVWSNRGRNSEKPMSSPEPSPVTVATLAAFSDAWNRHDVDALMSFMSDDCEFLSAGGDAACGTRHVGRTAVQKAFAATWAAVPDAHWGRGKHFVQGDFGLSEWTFTGTAADGSLIETDGVDVFTFRDGKIRVKNAFRKLRPNIAAVK